jgi:hypothetical protein
MSTGSSPAPGFRIHRYNIVAYSNGFCKVGLRKERVHGKDENRLLRQLSENKLGISKNSSERAFLKHVIDFLLD